MTFVIMPPQQKSHASLRNDSKQSAHEVKTITRNDCIILL